MPSQEYLEAILDRAKAHLSADDFKALQRAAIPRAGGKASWRAPHLSNIERFALKELRPALLQRADDAELSHLWSKLNQWYKRATRRKESTEAYERAASQVAQELVARGKAPTGKLMELAKSHASLAERLEELPDLVVMSSPAVAISHDDWDLYVAASEGQFGEAVIDELASIGVPAQMDMMTPDERESSHLYDLALIRTSRLEKSDHAPDYLTKAERHGGVMLALMAPDSVRDALEREGLLKGDKEGLHVTLLYLGKAADITTEQRSAIKEQVARVCDEHRKLKVKLSGIGKFAPGKDGTPSYVVASSVGLSQLQADLERAVSQVIDLPSEHGWVPHLTLGYDIGELPDVANVQLPQWTAEAVTLKIGDERFELPLGGKEPADKAAWDLEEKVIRREEGEELPWALYSRDGKLLGRHATEAEALAQERAIQVNKAVRIACAADKQIIYYLVSEPNTIDAHGHRITAETIEDALHGYVANSREVKLEHGKTITGRAVVVEAFIAPVDMDTFHGEKPPEPIKRGSSIVAIHYTDGALYRKLKDDPEHGISWGGFAQKVKR